MLHNKGSLDASEIKASAELFPIPFFMNIDEFIAFAPVKAGTIGESAPQNASTGVVIIPSNLSLTLTAGV